MPEEPGSSERGDAAQRSGSSRRRRTRRLRLVSLTVAALAAASAVLIALALADTVGGFEIDADHTNTGDALYSGTESGDPGDDWAAGTSQDGVFVPTPGGGTPTAADDCYGSDIDKNLEPSTLICDGNSDAKFKATEPEQNIVSPSGKTPDDVWPIKPGNVRPKNDFSHAYVHAALVDSPCDDDGPVGPTGEVADDTVLHLGGHVGDNEGSHFWGFEFNSKAPAGFNLLKANGGASFNLDFDRTVGDFLVSFTVPGNAADPVQLDLFTVSSFQPDGDANFSLAGTLSGCPTGQPQGLSKLTTNNAHDVEAPPWNIPVCDPTADNGANTCRLANGTTNSEDLLAPRDFAEASIDLTAFGINPCVSNVIFTSRSSHVLEGADIQDVGGGDFPLCGKKAGTKFHDLNADGDRDTGEPGLGGWPIKLYTDANGDEILTDTDDGADDDVVTPFRTTTTSTAAATLGEYAFTTLPNGDYIVCESAQPPLASGLPTTGWTESLPKTGTTGLADCNNDDTSLAANGYGFTMSGVDHLGNDFGNFRNATVSGMKFKDADAGGDKDAGEIGLGGWEIHLFGTDGQGNSVHQHTTTASDGTYSFTAPPGSYTVCETIVQTGLPNPFDQPGWKETFPTASTTGQTSCTAHVHDSKTPATRGYAVTATSGDPFANRDFGNTPLSTITVTFNPQAKLPGGTTDATKATAISCVDKGGGAGSTSVGSNTNSNTLTTSSVDTSQSTVVCTVTYQDP